MKLFDAIEKYPEVLIFREVSAEAEETEDYEYEPTSLKVVPDQEGFFVVKATWLKGRAEIPCYMDLVMPERVNDYTYFKTWLGWRKRSTHKLPGDQIPKVATETFGLYELYQSNLNPEIGLEVLRSGLKLAKHKEHICMDLGYILRDLERRDEAINYFKTAIKYGAKTGYEFVELADLYRDLGDVKSENIYRQKAKKILKDAYP